MEGDLGGPTVYRGAPSKRVGGVHRLQISERRRKPKGIPLWFSSISMYTSIHISTYLYIDIYIYIYIYIISYSQVSADSVERQSDVCESVRQANVLAHCRICIDIKPYSRGLSQQR